MKIYFGTDHAGLELKEQVKNWLVGLGHEVKDFGAFKFNSNDDYPDFVRPTAEAVANDPERSRGIIIGGSGQGEAICANRTKGIRSAVYYGGNIEIVELSRKHNNANILSLGAGFLSFDEAKKAVEVFLSTNFEGGRHERRINKIDKT